MQPLNVIIQFIHIYTDDGVHSALKITAEATLYLTISMLPPPHIPPWPPPPQPQPPLPHPLTPSFYGQMGLLLTYDTWTKPSPDCGLRTDPSRENTSAGNYRYIPLSLFLYRSIVVKFNWMAGGMLSLTVDILYVNLLMVGPSHILTILKCKLGTFSMNYSNLQKIKR